MTTRPISPERLVRRQVVLEDHEPLPDGRAAIVVERRVYADTYRSHLVLVRFERAVSPRRLTRGAVRDTGPRVSPDGGRVAFVRSVPDDPVGTSRLMVLALDGEEPVVIWEAPRGISEVAWAPDGRRLAIVAPADPSRFLVGATSGQRAPTARRITRIDWRSDEIGHRDRWDQVWVLTAHAGAKPRQVTHGESDVKGVAWSPDGDWLAFGADPSPDADIHPRQSIWVVPAPASGHGVPGARGALGRNAVAAANGAAPREVISLAGHAGSPAFSPDGRWLACVGVDAAEPLDDALPGLFVAPFERTGGGSGPAGVGATGTLAPRGATGRLAPRHAIALAPRHAIALAPDLDLPVGACLDTDLNGWMASARCGPFWDGSSALIAMVSEAGRSLPWRFELTADGRPAAAPTKLVTGDVAAWSIGVAGAPGRSTISLVGTLGVRPMELMTVERPGAPGARLRTWTRSGSAWRRGLAWPEMRRVRVPGRSGSVESRGGSVESRGGSVESRGGGESRGGIETWIASPAGAGDAALPTVFDIHGGPLGGWAPAPSLEVALLCSRGYRVVLPNIRGSAGYGAAWIAPQLGDWGGVDADDVLAAVAHVVDLGLADPARLGILGLSYGGFMVNWLVGTAPDRFAAAVSENGVTNQVSDWANSDSGPEYDRAARLGDVFSQDGIARLWRQSPLRLVSNVRTPILLLQGEADLRCPPHDNEQFFVALRSLGRTVEYVLYPESHHTFAVTGRPDRRIDRHARMLAWFDRFLGA